MNLRTALSNIHSDPYWWRKILIGGALMGTLVGYPFGAGLMMESLDNSRKGYPTPLPPWIDLSTRYVIGLFAVLIDFLFFVVPLFVTAILFFCMAIFVTISGTASLVYWSISVGGGLLLAFEVFMFVASVAPVGRLIYVDEGGPEKAMSSESLREALRAGARRVYARARLISLPAYLPWLALTGMLWWMVQATFPWAWLLTLILLWLWFSALLYAHLVVAQIYAGAERELRERGLERLPPGFRS